MRKIVSGLEGQALNVLFEDAHRLGTSPDINDLSGLLCSVRFANLAPANYRYSSRHYDVLIVSDGWRSKFYVRNQLGYWAQVGSFDGQRELSRHVGPAAPPYQARFVRVPTPHVEVHIHV